MLFCLPLYYFFLHRYVFALSLFLSPLLISPSLSLPAPLTLSPRKEIIWTVCSPPALLHPSFPSSPHMTTCRPPTKTPLLPSSLPLVNSSASPQRRTSGAPAVLSWADLWGRRSDALPGNSVAERPPSLLSLLHIDGEMQSMRKRERRNLQSVFTHMDKQGELRHQAAQFL